MSFLQSLDTTQLPKHFGLVLLKIKKSIFEHLSILMICLIFLPLLGSMLAVYSWLKNHPFPLNFQVYCHKLLHNNIPLWLFSFLHTKPSIFLPNLLCPVLWRSEKGTIIIPNLKSSLSLSYPSPPTFNLPFNPVCL